MARRQSPDHPRQPLYRSDRHAKCTRLVTVLHNPEHWNPRCGCMIPGALEAHVLVEASDALMAARDEFPNLKE